MFIRQVFHSVNSHDWVHGVSNPTLCKTLLAFEDTGTRQENTVVQQKEECPQQVKKTEELKQYME